MPHLRRWVLVACLTLALAACGTVAPTALPPLTRIVSTAAVTPLPTAAPPTTAPADTGWSVVAPGLERRGLVVVLPDWPLGEPLVVFRIDPAAFTLRVLYTPGFPSFVSAWDREARLVFNGGFFDEDDAALGLLVSDGRAYGQSYDGFGGMLAVNSLGVMSLRALAVEPYLPSEALAQAVQGFPVLVRPDGTIFDQADEQRARRTVIGQDAAGRLLLIVAPQGGFTLAGLAAWLRGSDLCLTLALNLDGGGSTGYYVGGADQFDSLAPVPAVIALYEK